jgi:hypothetical protein
LDFDFIEALEYGIPPTTGIGPGVERMAMIFTEQENIDDVIFFPLMRPAVSAFNAEIYGIEDRSVEPVQDLAITLEELKQLIEGGAIKPIGARVTVKPVLRIWPMKTGFRVTGQAELHGFAGLGVVHVSGYGRVVEKAVQHGDELEAFKGVLERELNPIFQAKYSQAHLRFVLPSQDE